MANPVYTTGDLILPRIAAHLGYLNPQELLGAAPWWQKALELAAETANAYCHKKVLAILGNSAAVQADAGMVVWVTRCGYYFALHDAAPLVDTINLAAVEKLSSVLEEGENWIPTVAPSGDLGVSHLANVGAMDTEGDLFKVTDQA